MSAATLFASLARISDLEEEGFECKRIAREHWECGDYLVGRATIARGGFADVEVSSGRIAKATTGDRIVGALGVRHATLEAVGSWELIGVDERMDMLTAAGLLGRATSVSGVLPSLIRLDYEGHVTRHGNKLRMRDFVTREPLESPFDIPTILLVGTSMSAGKTTSAKVIVRDLVRANHRVVGAKLTGAGRYRDILAMRDAGADAIFDFVDVGLPSSIGPRDQFRQDLARLLGMISDAKPEILVAEAGASPLEPYNGDVAVEQLGDAVKLTVLCSSDPYAVVGVMKGFGMQPDLVAGLATSTTAGVEVVQNLCGVPALNLLDPNAHPVLREMLDAALKR